MGRAPFYLTSNVLELWTNSNTQFMALNKQTLNIRPNWAFNRFTKSLIEQFRASFFGTSNRLQRVHLLVIELEHPVFEWFWCKTILGYGIKQLRNMYWHLLTLTDNTYVAKWPNSHFSKGQTFIFLSMFSNTTWIQMSGCIAHWFHQQWNTNCKFHGFLISFSNNSSICILLFGNNFCDKFCNWLAEIRKKGEVSFLDLIHFGTYSDSNMRMVWL